MSKELEALELIKIYKLYSKGSNTPQYIDLQKCFPEEWEIIEKSLKALEIIKKKDVDIKIFKRSCLVCNYDFYLKHNQHIMFGMTNELLTQEEFEILKEVLL